MFRRQGKASGDQERTDPKLDRKSSDILPMAETSFTENDGKGDVLLSQARDVERLVKRARLRLQTVRP